MKQYLELCEYVLKSGVEKIDRTQTGTISTFGTQIEINLEKGFPLLTTKKMFTKAIIYELLWFIKGDTNIRYLVQNNVRIWNEWPFQNYRQSSDYKNETMEDFIQKIKDDKIFADKWGELGPIYGKQWRNFSGVDQLSNVINQIKKNPNSRRLIISAWNPKDIAKVLLPPCHTFIQFYVDRDKLSCKLFQRSADVFLGVPFNIASYALLLSLIAKQCNLKPHKFIHTFGDAHIYLDHIHLVKKQLRNKPLKLCTLKINENIKSIFDYKYNDINFINYVSYGRIIGRVSV